MHEVEDKKAAAHAELARLSQDAKEAVHGIIALAVAEAGIGRQHVLALTQKFHEVLSVEVAPLDTVAKLRRFEDLTSALTQEKAALLDQARQLQEQVRTLTETNEAAGKAIADCEAQLEGVKTANVALRQQIAAASRPALAAEAVPQP